MIILKNNLKRVFLEKSNFLYIFLIPIIFSMFLLASNSGLYKAYMGVYIENNDEISKEVIKGLSKEFKVVEIADESDIEKKLLKNDIDVCLKFKKGFGENLLKGDKSNLEIIELKQRGDLEVLNKTIDYIVEGYATIGVTSGGDKDVMINKIQQGDKEIFSKDIENISGGKGTKKDTAMAMGLVAVSIMSTSFLSFIVEDKEEKLFARFMTTPMNIKSYHMQNLLTYLFITFLSAMVMLIFQVESLGVNIKGSIINIVIIFFLLGLVSTAECVFVSSISKNLRQFSAIQSLIYTPSILLCGCYFPRNMMPDLLQNISNIIPATWALKATDKVVYSGASINNLWLELSVLILFSVVFFLVASWKKNDLLQ